MGFYSDYVLKYGTESIKRTVNIEWVLKQFDEVNLMITDLPINADLNAILAVGCYYTPANATAQTIKNTPWGVGSSASAVSFSLEVVKHAGVTQILRTYNTSGYEYQRQYYNGTWGAWVRMARMTDAMAPEAHTHDDRYYTEAETDTKLNGKADSSHTHTKSQITDFSHTHDDRYYTESEIDAKLVFYLIHLT
jgi:hypothetical protein